MAHPAGRGGVAERSKAAVLKTAVPLCGTGGSNPSSSAMYRTVHGSAMHHPGYRCATCHAVRSSAMGHPGYRCATCHAVRGSAMHHPGYRCATCHAVRGCAMHHPGYRCATSHPVRGCAMHHPGYRCDTYHTVRGHATSHAAHGIAILRQAVGLPRAIRGARRRAAMVLADRALQTPAQPACRACRFMNHPGWQPAPVRAACELATLPCSRSRSGTMLRANIRS
jgi:hypothetical protein